MAQSRRLYRSRTNRKLAGVCGGLAQNFNIDPTLIRVLFVMLALLGGPGLVIYLLMWIIVPEEPQGATWQRAAVHPLPMALTVPHGLEECWLAWRSAVDL